MEAGLRVVRGPDWMWGNQDGGEGNVGTIIHLGQDGGSLPDGTVLVYWDSGKQMNYRVGHSGKFDLRILDSAPTGIKHVAVTCDGCREDPIVGTRWKCIDCFNYDLCTQCFMADVHDRNHSFLRIDKSRGEGVPVGKRADCTKIKSKGFFPGAKVTRGKDWEWTDQDGGNVGTLTAIKPWNGFPRSGASVTWNILRKYNYRTGYLGKVDLKCSTAAEGPTYYRECLAKVGEIRQRPNRLGVGDRVSVCLEADVVQALAQGHGGWQSSMADYIGKVGKIVKIDADGDVHVNYGLQSWVFHPDAVKKVSTFTSGTKVRVLSDRQLVQSLQQGHGGWNESMAGALGKEGVILEVDSDGDAVVMVGANLWLFNPEALEDLTDGEASVRRNDTPAGATGNDSSSLLQMLLLDAMLKGAAGDPGDRLVNASSSGNFQNVREILEAHPDKIDHKRNGKTALHVACHQGRPEIAKYLLGKGADQGIKDEQDYTALHHAAYGDRTGETVRIMIDTGVNVNVCDNQNKSTPLHLAVNQDNEAGVKALLSSSNCNVNCQDKEGDTPLHDAIAKDKNTIVDLILQCSRLDITITNIRGFNPLHLACLKGNKYAVQKIIDKYPGLIDIPKEDGFTALHLAAFNNHIEIAQCLLLSGHCGIDLPNHRGQTALALAVTQAYVKMIELLVEHGANVNAQDNDGDTPLHLAVILHAMDGTGLAGLLQSLVLSLPSGGERDENTASAIALYLVLHGAEVDFFNHQGKTPLDLCRNPVTANLLRQNARSRPRSSSTQRMTTYTPASNPFVRSQSEPPTSRPGSATYRPRPTPAPAPTPAPRAAPVARPRHQPQQQQQQQQRQQQQQPTASSASDTAQMQEKFRDAVNQAGPAETRCINCSERDAVVTFQPCGHKVTCSVCSVKLKRCLKCNSQIQQKETAAEAQRSGPTMGGEDMVRELERLQVLLQEREDVIVCAICMEREKNVVFLCGHMACSICSDRLQVCHICRVEIQNRVQVYR